MKQTISSRKFAALSAIAVLVMGSLAVMMMWSAPVTAQGSQADTAEEREAKNKQYRADADVLMAQIFEAERKIAQYAEQKENASSDGERQELERKIQASNDRIEELRQQILDIQALNQALYTEELQEKVYAAKKVLMDKYVNKDSDTHIGENPVEIVEANILEESITIVVNPDKVAADGSNVPDEKNVNGVEVKIRYGKIEPVSCLPFAHDGECRPIVGGVSTANEDLVPDSLNTVGYKATKSGVLGYVTAGHTTAGVGTVLVQPHDDASARVGVVPTGGYCKIPLLGAGHTCDFAFVDVDSGISVNDDIFVTPSNSMRDINSKRSDAGQSLGTFIAKSGAGSSYTSGEIIENDPNDNYNRADFNAITGDSGSPVYEWVDAGTGKAELFGMVYARGGDNDSYYFPQDFIASQIGAVASTS